MGKPDNTGIGRAIRATRYSAQGFKHAWRHEAAFRQEVTLAVLMIPGAFWLGRNVIEYILLVGCCLIVLIVELLNSAIEATVDRISEERNELSRRAKDLGSAAVFLSLALTVFVWALIAWQRFA